MTKDQLITTWRRYLASAEDGLHLADPAHPLQIFIGRSDQGTPRMVIRTVSRPATPALSNVVDVQRYEDGAGRWNLSLTLQNRAFTEVFLRLADHVHFRSAEARDEKTALDRVSVVLDEWRQLISPRRTGLLTMEELRGLVGEVWLMLDHFSRTRTMDATIQGWLGPMGLPQDFWFDGEGHFEAKAIGPATAYVKISSELQLDVDELELLVLSIANTAESTGGAFNLPMLVGRVAERLTGEGVGTRVMDDRIARLGVEMDEPFYSETWFVLDRIDRYRVAEGFPRVIASELPPGIERVRYAIAKRDLAPFAIGRLDG